MTNRRLCGTPRIAVRVGLAGNARILTAQTTRRHTRNFASGTHIAIRIARAGGASGNPSAVRTEEPSNITTHFSKTFLPVHALTQGRISIASCLQKTRVGRVA